MNPESPRLDREMLGPFLIATRAVAEPTEVTLENAFSRM